MGRLTKMKEEQMSTTQEFLSHLEREARKALRQNAEDLGFKVFIWSLPKGTLVQLELWDGVVFQGSLDRGSAFVNGYGLACDVAAEREAN